MPRKIVEEWAIFFAFTLPSLAFTFWQGMYVLGAGLLLLIICALLMLLHDIKRHRKEDGDGQK